MTAWYTGQAYQAVTHTHTHTLIVPDDILIQFDLLMMSTMMLETCREV